MIIRQALINDAEEIINIYNWYIENTAITFETKKISADDMKQRISKNLTEYEWLVCEVEGKVIGYAYYSSFRAREAYKHTAESTIYISNDYKNKGFGSILYERLFRIAKKKGIREIIGIVSLPNNESVSFHHKQGFKDIGVLRKVGYKFGKYIDIVILQKTIK